MARFLLECRFIYFSNNNRFYFDEMELSLHPSWNEFRDISNSLYDSYKKEYLDLAIKFMPITKALKKISFDLDDGVTLHVALNMCKKADGPSFWPGKTSIREISLS